MRGASDTHVHARPYGQTGLTSFKRRLNKLQRRRLAEYEKSQSAEDGTHCMLMCVMRIARAECALKRQIDISDSASISEVSVFTLLNAQ